MQQFEVNTLEGAIMYMGYMKAIVKQAAIHLESFLHKGVLDDAEAALIESLLIGATKMDSEFDQAMEHCMLRSDKVEHLLLTLARLLKENKQEKTNDGLHIHESQ
jgi:hypothetical protein